MESVASMAATPMFVVSKLSGLHASTPIEQSVQRILAQPNRNVFYAVTPGSKKSATRSKRPRTARHSVAQSTFMD
jgi:hypothetical protein